MSSFYSEYISNRDFFLSNQNSEEREENSGRCDLYDSLASPLFATAAGQTVTVGLG